MPDNRKRVNTGFTGPATEGLETHGVGDAKPVRYPTFEPRPWRVDSNGWPYRTSRPTMRAQAKKKKSPNAR